MSNTMSARRQLFSAIVCLILWCLLLMEQTGLENPYAWMLLAPALPLWLAMRALERRAYAPALGLAWLGAGGCALLTAISGFPTKFSLFGLVAFYFAAVAVALLRRLSQGKQ